MLHFYVHTLPPKIPVTIPPPLTLPILQVSAELQLPPTTVYSDVILHNWTIPNSTADCSNPIPTPENMRARTLFTGSIDEEEFYMTPARIELRGVEIFKLMHAILVDAASVDTDASAIQRITTYLTELSSIIPELRTLLLAQRNKVDPDYYYKHIRPWLLGSTSETPEGKWVFEGIERDPTLQLPTELFGSSAAQSSLIQSLDVFLGVDRYNDNNPNTSFIQQMRLYMPRKHRAFLEHLGDPGVMTMRPLREVVKMASDKRLLEAYNSAVRSLKEFRDTHMIIITLYIIGPARRLARMEKSGDNNDGGGGNGEPLKGTAGGDLAKLLKGFRDRTAGALMDSS